MSNEAKLEAESDSENGVGAHRRQRRGRVPAVIYGWDQEPTNISLNERELVKLLGTGHFMNSVVMIDTGQGSVRTMPKDVAFHPVTDRPLHVDFLRIGEHTTVTVQVPIVFTNEEDAPGIKKGGVLNIVRHELELVVDAAEIPSEIVVSLEGLDIGDAIHISDLKLPGGAKLAFEERDYVIATIASSDTKARKPTPEQNDVIYHAAQASEIQLGTTAGDSRVHVFSRTGPVSERSDDQEIKHITDDLILAAAADIVRARYENLIGTPSQHLAYLIGRTQHPMEAANV